MKSSEDLRSLLERIDHRGYPAYKETKGSYQFPGYILSIDHVQGDPFTSPSKVSVCVRGGQAGFPEVLYDCPWKKTALEDYLLRLFGQQAENYAFKAKGSGKSGLISVSRCGQEILERSACQIDSRSGDILVRMEVGFPANGRTINARELMKIFYEFLPECVKRTLYYRALDKKQVASVMELSEDQHYIRETIGKMGLVAFVANGAILPRATGISQKPMKGAVPFNAPESMEVTLSLPYGGNITGMGIPRGVILIVGGGYHGKSTLLEALERGVYDHIAGDGREFVITDATAMKIRAEDGRSVRNVDISMFIKDLPNGKDTTRFYTEDASGSTSQAANVVEAMESGSSLLLIDEDTSASNFMVRDALMQQVVAPSCEPITPLIERIRELYEVYGISSVIVAGSSGAYFHKADHIVQMNRYAPMDITALAKAKAAAFPLTAEPAEPWKKPDFHRVPAGRRGQGGRGEANGSGYGRAGAKRSGADGQGYGRGERSGAGEAGHSRDERVKVKTSGRDGVMLNKEMIDLRYVEQLVDSEQLTALGYMLAYASAHLMDGKRTLTQIVRELEQIVRTKGLQEICGGGYLPSGLAMPRTQEIFACFNRFRG